ncbi:MAG: tetratricopeptide repeat protein [Chitinophagaceae bacterium]|nr:tetratricopeptide repeat protein [Chitinophagaceae bacterium]
MKLILFLLLATLLTVTVQSQPINTDSLRNELKIAKNDTNKVILYRMLAGIVGNSNPAEAIEYGKAGLKLGKQLRWEKGIAGCYLNVAAAFGFKAQLDSAMLYIDSAIVSSKIVGDPTRLALAYLNKADYYMQLRNFKQSLINCDSAWRYAELANNNDRRARILQTIGAIYFYQSKYKEAIDYNERAGQLYRELGNKKMYAITLSNIGTGLTRTNEYAAAIENYQKAIALANEVGDRVNFAMYYGNISSNYIKQTLYEKAAENAQRAMEYALEHDNEKQIATAYSLFGEIYLKQKKYAQSIEAASKAYNGFQKNELQEEQQTAAEILAEAYSLSGNHKEAYNYLSKSKELSDTLATQKYDEDIAAMQTSFNVEEKNSQIALLNKDKELQQYRQRILVFSFLALAVIAIAGIIFLINRNKLRQRMKEMELRQSIAADLHDEVGSSLSSIYMLSEMAGASETSMPSQKEMLHKVTSYSKETMDKMGDIVWMIKQNTDDGKDLQERMQRFLYEMCSSKNISNRFDGELLQTLKLSTGQKKALYLIFKEAVNNALKYASPENIHVSISKQQNMVELKIVDDGKGFDVASDKKGNGLTNMQNRAKELGGKTAIISSEKGTTVICTLPV